MNGEEKDIPRYPWPSPNDRLFPRQSRPAPPSSDQALFEELIRPELGYYFREGYYHAGEFLARQLLDAPSPFQAHPGMVFPMLYVYRHYIEISLKALIGVYVGLSGESVKDGFNPIKEHSLARLWNEVRRLCELAIPASPEGDTTDVDVGRLINEFNQYDSSSQTFRYDKNRRGESVESSLPEVDLNRLMATMEKLKHYFDGSDAYADHLLSLSNENSW